MEEQTVQELLSLQDLDVTIAGHRAERIRLTAELDELDELQERWAAGELEQRGRVDEAALDVRRAERTVQAGRATVKHLQERAKGLQRSKDISAARTEIDTALENLDDAETAQLEAMQMHDRERIRLEEIDRQYGEERADASARRAEIEARLAEIDAELASLQGRRGETADRIDADVRSTYDRVRGGRTTQALAAIVDGCCGHCFTAIPKQRQAEIRAGRKLVVCEECGVILHAGA